ncbi:MAG: ion transporter [Bacteroidales bacterium]|nr:ion transporter [Bacteroidales bacterium]
MHKLKQQLARVFDDDLKTWQWKNIVDWTIIGLIVVSTVEVFLSTFDGINQRYGAWLGAVDLLTTAVFTVEVALRIWCADLIDPKYKGFWGRVRYCCTFYGLIDLVSTYSFYVALFFPVPYMALKVLRVFRLLRVFRYMKSFRLLSKAFGSKKSELWVSLQFLCIVTLILSFLLFFVEHQAQPEVYDNGWRSVVWAFAQYIGDPGSFADTPPITFWGRVIAVLVGVLGIAIFAVPAGLVGSGFIEAVEDERKEEELERRRDLIYQRFAANYSEKKALLSDGQHQRSAPARYLSTDYLRSICLLSESEILETVRSAPDLRMRSMKSDENLRVNDMMVVERYLAGEDYGFCRWNDDERLVVLNPAGATEYALSHVVATLAQNLTCNIITRERRFYGAASEDGIMASPFYADLEASDGNKMFERYVGALRRIRRGQRVLCLMSGASGGADFEVEWGMPMGTEGYRFEGAHVADGDRAWVQDFCERLKANASEITVHAASRKDFTFNFSVKTHSKGLGIGEKHIARAIYNHTGATVVMVYLNVLSILKAHDERYYAALKVLLDTISFFSF